ncbi:MAG: cupin domain-containing protein [Deltaproteobacteria bacterium]|nr:cupin domain-containing protein [Deltaproteobacteria bacterium]
MMNRAKELIELFQLSKHPEGGYFREVYRSEKKGKIDSYGNERNWMTDIFFLLTENDISRFHRLKHDEIWHFYEGSPITLTEIHQDSLDINTVTLGQPAPLLTYTYCVKGNNWQSAYSRGPYSFIGCTVGPGFEFEDFEMMAQCKEVKAAVLSKYPELGKYM